MKDNQYYTCEYCYKEFEPKRRRVQKYCSNTCRSKAYHARTQNNNNNNNTVEIPSVALQHENKEKMNLAGIGNATAGTLLAEGLKTILTKEDNKPATKGDFKKLIEALGARYLPIKNLPSDPNGNYPFYDTQNNTLVYLINVDSTYR